MVAFRTMLSKKLHSVVEDITKAKVEQAKTVTMQVHDVAIECIQVTHDRVVISASLGEISKIRRSLDEVLKKSLIWSANHSAVLSLQDSDLILFKEMEVKDLNKDSFEMELHSISSSVDFWREYLASEEEGKTNPYPSPVEASFRI